MIVETARGRQLGQVMGIIPPDRADMPRVKPIKSPASARDLLMKKLYEAKQVTALIDCREAASTMGGFDGVKFIRAEYNYDGSVLSFLYTSEEIVNTSRLRRELSKEYHTRIDMRRIGARDAAKLLGEYGACGSARCCSTHLTDFSPISIKMAKEQGISLNPSEITGMCGRLRCCLVYEYAQYVEAKKSLPRINKWIGTPHGEGKVIDLNPLAGMISVIVEGNRHEISKDEWMPLEEMRALKEKASAGCSKEGLGGVCECGGRVRTGPPAEATAPQDEVAQSQAESPAEPGQAGQEQRPGEGQGHRRSKRRRSRGGRSHKQQ